MSAWPAGRLFASGNLGQGLVCPGCWHAESGSDKQQDLPSSAASCPTGLITSPRPLAGRLVLEKERESLRVRWRVRAACCQGWPWSLLSARRARALLLPPPRPPSVGMVFSRWMRTPSGSPNPAQTPRRAHRPGCPNRWGCPVGCRSVRCHFGQFKNEPIKNGHPEH
ncbi:MAG: hypothetical protein CM1200mP29_05260 [Verrucomicrobiota bacterium]|nr:MAG: hypothetical protein CM1200mP29_05260 [Verrucomicrobiota bacterium]